MRLLDTFAGIGGFSLGLERAGMTTVAICEKDKHAQKILKRHYPKTPIIGDIHDVRKNDLSTIDIISGGTPCQDLSIAGNRKGLAGEKSGLFFEWLRVVADIKPRWIFWENVAGALHANSGRDFATILIQLQKLGYSLAWRVLDAQWFGVPQRRRRVFIVGHFTDGCAAQVLFEQTGYSGRVKQGCKTRQTDVERIEGDNRKLHREPIAFRMYAQAESGLAESTTTAPTLVAAGSNRQPAIALDCRSHRANYEISGTLQAKSNGGWSLNYINPVIVAGIVRRLTPVECERLQGYPQGWTGGQADTHRYKQLGNAVAVPVVEAIARRIMAVEAQQERLDERVS